MSQALDVKLHAIEDVHQDKIGVQCCAHCGEICENSQDQIGTLTFCCGGCKSVYTILQNHDLCGYYDRGDVGVAMRHLTTAGDQFAVLDDPEIKYQLLIFSSEGLNRVTLTVPAIHCASCLWLLEQLDRLDSGVIATTVDVMRKSVTIDYDPGRTSLRGIAERLSSIGYSPLIQLDDERLPHNVSRVLYTRIGLAGFATINTMLVAFAQYFAGSNGVEPELLTAFRIVSIILSVPVLLFSASPWLTAAWTSIRQRRISLDVPVAIGILILFSRSAIDVLSGRGEGYFDSFNTLVFLLLIGRLFQQKAFDAISFDRTYRSFFPLSVRVRREGNLVTVPVEQININDILVIRNGEIVPCDCQLVIGTGYFDYSFVTGESTPIESVEGQIVHAGGRVVGASITLRSIKQVDHAELARMWDRSSQRTKHKTLLTISDSFGRWFTILALTFAIIGGLSWLPDWEMAFDVFTAVLIIACPCALTLAAPITLGTAMGRLGTFGIYLKNIGTLLDLERVTAIFFDKTGTLTASEQSLSFEGRKLAVNEWEAVRNIAAQSTHPISRSIAGNRTSQDVDELQEFAGAGVAGKSCGHQIVLGSTTFVTNHVTDSDRCSEPLTRHSASGSTHLAIDGQYAGAFILQSALRNNIEDTIKILRLVGKTLKVISGDTARDEALIAPLFSEAHVKFNCTPETKISEIERTQAQGECVLMVGDGLNDAGAMQVADVAMAVTENTATIVPACDVIIHSDSLSHLPVILGYAVRMKHIILLCFFISLIYNAIGLSFAVAGSLSPLVAAIFMPVSSLTIIGLSVAGARFSRLQLPTRASTNSEIRV